MERNCGILMPIFSLPNDYSMGSFGKEAYDFVDFLKKSNHRLWQILPLVQTELESPYSSLSSQSFNPFMISIELLCDEGLITKQELNNECNQCLRVDYARLNRSRIELLYRAFSRFDKSDKDFSLSLKKKEFRDYALFMSKKEVSPLAFYDWEKEFVRRDESALNEFENQYKDRVLFWQFVQFIAKKQWLNLKEYANQNGIMIIGDMPLYVSLDSVDVWVNPTLFKLDSHYKPKKVAGVPPDYFCADGQLWGNPVYDYERHKADNFDWWTKRLKSTLTIFDYVRIDHFRGLDRYYEIDASAKDAKNGLWKKVPSKELFSSLNSQIDCSKIIAEDLGIIDDGVRKLLKFTGYPGMKVLSFAFNGKDDNLYLPQNLCENSICYTGTHDNDTLIGLLENLNDWDYKVLKNGVINSASMLGVEFDIKDNYDLANAIAELGYMSKSNVFIIPYQDVLLKRGDYRINTPGTVNPKNWSVRFNKDDFSDDVANTLKEFATLYNR